jgi:hypothetical protein
MPDSVQRHELNAVPDESTIRSLREDAKAEEVSVEVSFPVGDDEEKRLVVSPRGTVVLLNDVSEETFNQSKTAADIADALRDG